MAANVSPLSALMLLGRKQWTTTMLVSERCGWILDDSQRQHAISIC